MSSVSPNNGPLAGGTAVTITGTNFPAAVDSVRVGTGRLGSLVRVSATQLTGMTPATGTAGAVDVTVYATNAGGGTCTGCFTYNPALTVSSVSPNNGPLAGGTSVTITGTYFVNVTGVTVGGGALQNLSAVGSTQLTGTTPASASSGAKDVVVSSSSHNSGACTGCFTYNPVVTVSSVSPNNGPLAGGTAVTIAGTFPATVDSVRVGTGRLGSLVRVSGTQLTGTTPANASSGAHDVVVSSSSHGSGTCIGCYTYNPTMSVIGVSPTSGPLAGGTAVTLTGTNFPATVDSVRVGGGRLASLARVSATQLTGTIPASGAPGAVDVVIYASSAGSGTCTRCYTYSPTLTGAWTSLIAAQDRTCGLTNAGAAYCWGYNYWGQLGDLSTTNRSTPVAVVGGIVFASLTGNGHHSCGLTSGATAYCWGYNNYGQLGDSSTTDRRTPVAVRGGTTFASLAAGGGHTCGLTSTGAAYCWGLNNVGQLGQPGASRTTPVAVAGGTVFASLAVSDWDHTCGLSSSGAAYCWGLNGWGALGDRSDSNRTVPVAVAGGITFARVVAGRYHTCGLTSSGAAYCWGRNYYGELGDGTTTDRWQPVPVSGGTTFAVLTAGGEHTCGLTSGGAAYCWGENYFGQLGDGTTTTRVTPVTVAGGITFASLTAGTQHTCGLTSGGAAYCWGGGFEGALGNGSTTDRSTPALVVSP